MLSNNSGVDVGYLAGKYEGMPSCVGHLYSPGGQRGPKKYLPYALDNGAFGHDHDWNEAAWLQLLGWAKLSGQNPLWALVPDVVADRNRTLQRWSDYSPIAARYGWPLAFAVQDGMVVEDVPDGADVVFVGGTTEWKWATARMWCEWFPHVHIARVNTYKLLWKAHDAGAKSGDGTGFTRGCQKQVRDLNAYLQESNGLMLRSFQASFT